METYCRVSSDLILGHFYLGWSAFLTDSFLGHSDLKSLRGCAGEPICTFFLWFIFYVKSEDMNESVCAHYDTCD